jgi:sorting nexin-1/2
VADYVSRLKLRVEKMLLATSALVKHSAHTAGVLMQFAAVVCDLDQAEARATAVFYNNPSSALAGSAAAGVAGAGGAGAGAGHIPTVEGVQWMAAARLFAAASGPPRAHADAVTAAFQEPLEAAAALCQACVSSCDVRKGIVDHYNRLCRQIERLDSKVSTLGVPEPGPKREEKQKVELAASDLRIARTQAMGRYERCCEYMAHELLWFHTELARTLGAALQALVAAQGAAAGQALHACQGHFAAILSAPPAAFRGALGEGAVGGPGSSGSAGSAGSAGGVGDAGGRLEFGGVMHGGVDAGVTA